MVKPKIALNQGFCEPEQQTIITRFSRKLSNLFSFFLIEKHCQSIIIISEFYIEIVVLPQVLDDRCLRRQGVEISTLSPEKKFKIIIL